MNRLVYGELFPTIADKVLCFQNKLYCNPKDIKNGDIIYCDTHEINKFKDVLKTLKDLTIITHNSDGFLIDRNQDIELTPRQEKNHDLFSVIVDDFSQSFKKWYGLNVYTENKKVVPIPIGMPPPIYIKNKGISEKNYINIKIDTEGETMLDFSIERTEKDLVDISLIDSVPKKVMYLNLTKETNPKERQECYNQCPRSKNNTIELSRPFNMALRHRDYLMKIKDHKFIISAPGGQLDCYRTWETLAMKRVPILKNVGRLKELYKNIPSIFVDNWSELKTIDTTVQFDFSDQSYLFFNFWSGKIKEGTL
jgi:hypothetical protein